MKNKMEYRGDDAEGNSWFLVNKNSEKEINLRVNTDGTLLVKSTWGNDRLVIIQPNKTNEITVSVQVGPRP